jgi:hypothetical protein
MTERKEGQPEFSYRWTKDPLEIRHKRVKGEDVEYKHTVQLTQRPRKKGDSNIGDFRYPEGPIKVRFIGDVKDRLAKNEEYLYVTVIDTKLQQDDYLKDPYHPLHNCYIHISDLGDKELREKKEKNKTPGKRKISRTPAAQMQIEPQQNTPTAINQTEQKTETKEEKKIGFEYRIRTGDFPIFVEPNDFDKGQKLTKEDCLLGYAYDPLTIWVDEKWEDAWNKEKGDHYLEGHVTAVTSKDFNLFKKRVFVPFRYATRKPEGYAKTGRPKKKDEQIPF